MDTPPDLRSLHRQAARGSARRLYGEGITAAPGRHGRNPGTDTRMIAGSRGVDVPTILCLVRAVQATPLARGRTA